MKKFTLSQYLLALGILCSTPVMAMPGGGDGYCMRHGGSYFSQADTNKDGSIDKAEAQAMHEKRFEEMDTNHDGKLDKDEMQKCMRMSKHKMGSMGFMGADKDNDGTLDRNEAAELPHVHQHFDEIDIDKDGTVSRDEVHNYMKDHRP